MRKLLTFFFALALTVGVSVGAFGQAIIGSGIWGDVKPRVPAASYTFQGTTDTAPLGGPWTASMNIGAAANRLIIVGIAAQGGTTTAVTVNGVSLTEAGTSSAGGGGNSSLWYGLVTSGSGPQSIVVTGNTFFSQALSVYSVYGLGTNSPQNTVTGGTSVSIGVNAGDFLFAISEAQDTAGWGGSTQAPAKTYSDTNQGPSLFLNGADWTIASTNASFSVSGLATSGSLVAANWR